MTPYEQIKECAAYIAQATAHVRLYCLSDGVCISARTTHRNRTFEQSTVVPWAELEALTYPLSQIAHTIILDAKMQRSNYAVRIAKQSAEKRAATIAAKKARAQNGD